MELQSQSELQEEVVNAKDENARLRESNILLLKINLKLSKALVLKYKAALAEIELTRELLQAGLLTKNDIVSGKANSGSDTIRERERE